MEGLPNHFLTGNSRSFRICIRVGASAQSAIKQAACCWVEIDIVEQNRGTSPVAYWRWLVRGNLHESYLDGNFFSRGNLFQSRDRERAGVSVWRRPHFHQVIYGVSIHARIRVQSPFLQPLTAPCRKN